MQFFLQKSQPKFEFKFGFFGYFQLIKKYDETTLLIDDEYKLQEASYTNQQSSTEVKSPKTCLNEGIFA